MLSRSDALISWKIRLVLIVSLFVSSMMPTTLVVAAPPPTLVMLAPLQQTDSEPDLWLDISLGPPLIDWFNQVARPDDIARIERIQQVNLLDEITAGRKLVVFKSIEDAEEVLPHIADRIDIVGYNLENGQYNRPWEKANPVDSVKRMRELADEYDLLLAFGPDHELAISDGVAVAPYVDIFVLQVQRVQTDPAKVSSFVWPLIPQLRRANPDIEISVQVRTEGDVDEIVELINDMKNQLDGVSILTSPETVDVAEALVSELQTRTVERATPRPVPVAPSAPPPAEKIGIRIAAEPPKEKDTTSLSCPLMVVGAFIAGGIGGGVTATLIWASRKGAGGTTNERS